MLVLVSCGGGDGDGGGAAPSFSPTRTPTTTPSLSELPSPTRSPSGTDSPGLPSETAPPGASETTDDPEVQPSAEPSTEEPATQTPVPTTPETETSPETTAAEPVAEPAEDEKPTSTFWWLLAVVVIGSAVAVALVGRARRRSAWQRRLLDAEGEVAWFARELLPALRQSGSQAMVAGGWAVGQARVSAAEDELTVLASSAPGDGGRERAQSLREATRHARTRLERLTASGATDTWMLDIDETIADLEAALRPSPPSTVSAPG